MVEDLTRQFQSITHEVGGSVGDCHRTAIACLLGISLHDVPHFAELYPGEKDLEWWYKTVEFVERAKPGWTLECYVEPEFPIYNWPDLAPDSVILTGPSPRGPWGHCVLGDARTGEMVWDPYPSQEGLLSVDEVYILTQV